MQRLTAVPARHCFHQCLLPFMKQLLRKPFPNYNFDLISILCGSLEQSDLVLSVRPISLGDVRVSHALF